MLSTAVQFAHIDQGIAKLQPLNNISRYPNKEEEQKRFKCENFGDV